MDLTSWLGIIGLFIAIATLMFGLYKYNQTERGAELSKIEHALARHAAEDAEKFRDISAFMRATNSDIGKDFVRRDEFNQAQMATQGALNRIEDALIDINRYLRSTPVSRHDSGS